MHGGSRARGAGAPEPAVTGEQEQPAAQAPAASPLPRWWSRDFPGEPPLVRQVRSWIAGLLPACDPLDDLLVFASELSTNAVTHTRSGEPGGQFTVEVTWSPDSARVVVGDRGSDEVPRTVPSRGDQDAHAESGRGLRLIDGLSDAWGIAGDADARWLWAEVRWRSRGGPPPPENTSRNAAEAQFVATRCAYPEVRAWYSAQSGEWCATLPDARDILRAPSPLALTHMLAARYPAAAGTDPGGPQRLATPPALPLAAGSQRAHR